MVQLGNSAQVVIKMYEFVAEVQERTASVAVDVLNVFGGHVELCIIAPNFVILLGQVMQRRRNLRLMWQKTRVHCNALDLRCDPCFNLTRANKKKWRWAERQEATILSLSHSYWPEDQTIEHPLLDFGEVELATNFFQLIIKPLPI